MIHIYSFASQKMLLFSNQDKDKIKKKYGNKYEILNSIKDSSSIPFMMDKMTRQCPTFMIVEDYFVKKTLSDDHKKRIGLSKVGKKRPDWVKKKISKSRSGKGNFKGKRHNEISKQKIAEKLLGTDHVEDRKYIYNPTTDEERRVKNVVNLPNGFRKGRDPEVIDQMHYGLSRSRNSK